MTTQELRTKIDRKRGEQTNTQAEFDRAKLQIRNSDRELKQYEQAREVVKEVGLQTQNQLSFHISDITSLALEAVFENPYQLEAEFVERRNKTECDLYFSREGNRVDPLTASGGGAVDVAAFALRVASWSMQNPRKRNVIILDEPMRFLSEDMQEQASKMLKEISDRLGIQFIIITHEPTLAAYADKTFNVSIRKRVSRVREVTSKEE
jgi:DNA repair exonuclease SbcCD ATPase subunit